MHILILQHARLEHAGAFRSFLAEDGHQATVVHMDEGDALPDIADFDALWVLGGPMDVWEEDIHPWLAAEKEFIRDAVEGRGVPFLGLCLGHQLLAEALGGTVGKAKTPEIGVMDVMLTEDGANGVLFDGLPEKFPTLQWHSAEVTRLPPGAQVLATSPDCVVQAMKWGTRAASVQFHLEVEPDTVPSWASLPAYAAALDTAMGPNGAKQLQTDVSSRITDMNSWAERFYINWLQMTSRVTSQPSVFT